MKNININEIAFEIVSLAGDARATLLTVLNDAKQATTQQRSDQTWIANIKSQVADAQGLITECHNKQTDILQDEAAGASHQVSFLMVHAQDHLMTTMLLKEMIEHILFLYGVKI